MGDPSQSALGATIRDLREQTGMSQEAFAAKVGLHRTYVGSIERGERNVSLKNIMRIADALGTTGTELLRRSGL